MKNCKSCNKEIDTVASKCPYCQAFQVWYKNPQTYGWILPIFFVPLMFYYTGLFGQPKFEDHKDQITADFINENQVDGRKVINYKIRNASNITWNDISYSVNGYDEKGDLVISNSGGEFNWLLPHNGDSILSVIVNNDQKIKSWELKITNLRKDRF
jgi:hypothetical protein